MTDWVYSVSATAFLRKTIARNFKNIPGLNGNKKVKNIEPHAEENCILIKS